MQIGVRWRAGDVPHPQVPDALRDALTALDAREPVESSWTLTWLEGRPRCERGDGYRVLLNAAHSVETLGPDDTESYDDEEDDWL